ncbi:MAG: multicopper oxidase family protein [Gemmatimonadales bacterium]
MDRRTFLACIGAAAPLTLPDGLRGLSAMAPQVAGRNPLRRIPDMSGRQLTLTAGPTRADVGVGVVDALTINGMLPSPTIRLREGDAARIDLVNELPEPTILHWHGLAVPEAADGHPRLAIPPGATYRYRFDVEGPAGTYWYHPHTHMRTAAQTYRGMGGFLIVEGDEEAAHGLPSAEYEIPLLLQDKRLSSTPSLDYAMPMGMGPDAMLGYLGNTAFANGIANPTLDVQRTRYRLRILNGSTSRIFDLALSSGDPLTMIGSDGGLLELPVRLERLTLAPAERADVLVDFSGRRPGERIVLRSLPFEIPGMMMGMGMGMGRGMRGRMGRGAEGGVPLPQGAAMDLVEFVVGEGPVDTPPPVPARLRTLPAPILGDAPARRTFPFDSMMMRHTIGGRTFDLERVDARVRLGEPEIWTYVNGSGLPHPVHVHGGQFRVLLRSGGRGRVMPWESGLKDTVLVLPGERVDVAVRFVHPGLFLMHCHNLEHEDSGMMLNFEVLA